MKPRKPLVQFTMTNYQKTLHALGISAIIVLTGNLSGCLTTAKNDHNAKPDVNIAEGSVKMPAGADYKRIKLAEQGIKTKIYTIVKGMGDPSNEKLLFPVEVAKSIGVTPVQIQRRFMDTVGKTRRFEVYDSSTSVTADQSDYVVDAMFTGSTQELRRMEGGVRVAVTRVRLSANLIDRYSGKPIWDAPVEVVGETGGSTGDRVALLGSENENQPAVQRRLGIDYERAMQRALDQMARRIDLALRPLGRVISLDGDSISIIGGLRNGLQGGDEMVVFKASLVKIGSSDELSGIRPVAAVRCDGVGSATSQCDVIRRDKRLQIQVGDYVILNDHSALGTRVDL